MIELTFAELHTPLFLGGTNWQLKLDIKNTAKGKLSLAYDRENHELIVKANGHIAIIPTSNVVSMTPMPEGLIAQTQHLAEPLVDLVVNPPKPKGRPKAQASTPMDHAHKGLGFGKTND